MRVLLYARYSTDLQDPLSIDTQLTMCRRELTQRKWTEVGCYTDGAQSGATIHRAGLQALLAAVGTAGSTASIRYRISAAKLPVVKDLDALVYDGTPINEGLVRLLHSGSFIPGQRTIVYPEPTSRNSATTRSLCRCAVSTPTVG